ncbi:MAG: helix-turn-helix domain-containing protein [Kiritimatiellae bacterium]|nr:helix-turn-helix domain-containing protein [Kiritimatiellia bacterium]
MKYHGLTEEKRIIIEALRKEGCSKKHMAERAECQTTTVWRELKRRAEAQRQQERLPAQEGAGQGKPPCCHEGREEAQVHVGDAGAGDGSPGEGLDVRAGPRTLLARRHCDGVRRNALQLQGVLQASSTA